jgi:hypothetical protein
VTFVVDTQVEGMLIIIVVVALGLVSLTWLAVVVTLFAKRLLINDVDEVGDETPPALDVVAGD